MNAMFLDDRALVLLNQAPQSRRQPASQCLRHHLGKDVYDVDGVVIPKGRCIRCLGQQD